MERAGDGAHQDAHVISAQKRPVITLFLTIDSTEAYNGRLKIKNLDFEYDFRSASHWFIFRFSLCPL
jgi:hypothetical protein